MQNTVLRYGTFAALTIIVLGMISLVAVKSGYELQEIMGYLTILISMIFVFLGIRHYRDHVNNGQLSFGQGMMVGLLIVLIPSIAFGVLDYVYTHFINPGWMDNYYDKYIAKYKSDPNFEAKKKEILAQKAIFSNPIFSFLLMASTVLIIGIIVTIISAIALKRKERAY